VIASVLIGIEVAFQKIWKEEYFQDNEHDKQFD
jgi:hypothetical protein